MSTTTSSPAKPDIDTESRTGFGTTAGTDDGALPENSKDNLDEKLDNAVDETFPGSDPISVKITK